MSSREHPLQMLVRTYPDVKRESRTLMEYTLRGSETALRDILPDEYVFIKAE